jgi:hypothetical protein
VKPVFWRENGSIQKFPRLARAIKYSIFYNKIQDLPHILCTDFLYYDEKGMGPFSAEGRSDRRGA